jgi:hypothetical protein
LKADDSEIHLMTIAAEAAAAKPRRRWPRRLAWLFGLVALMAVWWTQPHFGANVCPLKGFIWEIDFVDKVRPTIRSIVGKRGLQLGSELLAGLTDGPTNRRRKLV